MLACLSSINLLNLNIPDFVSSGILQRLLMVEWKGPVLVELHTRHFDAIGPYFKHSPAAIPLVVEKLFKLLTSLPVSRVSAFYPFWLF